MSIEVLTVLLTFGGSILSVGITWGLLRGQIKALEAAAKSLDDDRAKQRQEIIALQLKWAGITGDLKTIEELKQNAINPKWLDERMSNQDAALKALHGDNREIKETLRNKQSVPSMQRVIVPRVEPPSEPPEVPRMRPRLPSQRDR